MLTSNSPLRAPLDVLTLHIPEQTNCFSVETVAFSRVSVVAPTRVVFKYLV
jgi:hypothetical protein